MAPEDFLRDFEAAKAKSPGGFLDHNGEPMTVPETEASVRSAEDSLGVRLPESFRWYLKTIGGGGFRTEEVFTITGTDAPNLCEENARFDRSKFVAVINDGAGGCYGFVPSGGVCGERLVYCEEFYGTIEPATDPTFLDKMHRELLWVLDWDRWRREQRTR